jgi:hypothetical protein
LHHFPVPGLLWFEFLKQAIIAVKLTQRECPANREEKRHAGSGFCPFLKNAQWFL